MTELAPGIHWLKLPNTSEVSSLTHVNVYLFRGDNGYLIVDAGWNTDSSFHTLPNHREKNTLGVEVIREMFAADGPPHPFGMAGRIARLSGAPLATHPLEQAEIQPRYVHFEELLHKTDRLLVANGMARNEAAKLRDASLGMQKYVVPIEPDWLLREGDTVTTGEFTFRVIWTPGHASGHLCLYEADRKILVSGDHILPRITPNVSLHPLAIENPLGRYLESLKQIRSLDDLFPLVPGVDVVDANWGGLLVNQGLANTLLFLADVPGFMIGTEVERQGIIRHGAKMISAVSEATVPKISVVVRKAYGAGLYAMAGPAFEPDCSIALPTASIDSEANRHTISPPISRLRGDSPAGSHRAARCSSANSSASTTFAGISAIT